MATKEPKPSDPTGGETKATTDVQPEAAGHRWRGGGVEPTAPGAESTPEAAAQRAEGNGPGDATGTFAWRHPPHAEASPADEAENAEEKRQAAAEEHAEQPLKHAPHGRL